MRAPQIAALSVLSALVLAACGDDSTGHDTTDAAATTPTTAASSDEPAATEPADVARALLLAYGAGDTSTACELQTKRYVDAELAGAIADGTLKKGAGCEDLVAAAAEYYAYFQLDAAAATYDEISNNGRTARVRVTWADGTPADPTTLVFVNRAGAWLLDDEPE